MLLSFMVLQWYIGNIACSPSGFTTLIQHEQHMLGGRLFTVPEAAVICILRHQACPPACSHPIAMQMLLLLFSAGKGILALRP